jgi:hypothetical protein
MGTNSDILIDNHIKLHFSENLTFQKFNTSHLLKHANRCQLKFWSHICNQSVLTGLEVQKLKFFAPGFATI